MTEILSAVASSSVLVFLLASMSEIGLGLRLGQVVAPLRNPRLVALALIANFAIAPLLALGIARLLRLDEPFSLGLLLLGLAAGAPFMPKIVSISKADVGLAVGLLVMLMVGTIVFLPVALPFLVTGTHVEAGKIIRLLTVLILLPLAIGLIVKQRAPSIAARLAPVLRVLSGVTLVTTIILTIALHIDSLLRVFGTGAIYAGLLFSLLSALSGWLLGGRDEATRTTLGLATGFRSFPAALIVSVQNFTDPNVSVMVIVTTLTALVVLVPVARLLGRRGTGTGTEGTEAGKVVAHSRQGTEAGKVVAHSRHAGDLPGEGQV